MHPERTIDRSPQKMTWWPGALVAALFLVVATPAFVAEARRPLPGAGVSAGPQTSEAFDQDEYHLPIILMFAEQLPRPDLRGYPAATTPGYHLVQAAVWRATSNKAAMLAVNLMIGLGLVVLVWAVAARQAGAARAVILTLPVAWSVYVLGASIWVTTDNLGWLAALGAVGVSAMPGRSIPRTVGAGVCAALAVFVRQIHIWALAPAVLSGLMRSPLARWVPGVVFDEEERDAPRSWRGLAAGVCAGALPVIVVGGFVLAWGGLLPMNDEMRSRHGGGFAPGGPAFFMACLGVFGWPVLVLVPGAIRRVARDPVAWFIVGAGVLVAAVPHTSFDPDAQRKFGWLWHGVRVVQDAGGEAFAVRSPVLIALAGVGVLSILVCWRAARARGFGGSACILMLSALGFALAQSANSAVWQRYYEPMALVTVAWLVSLGVPKDLPAWRWSGFAAIALAQLGLALATVIAPAL